MLSKARELVTFAVWYDGLTLFLRKTFAINVDSLTKPMSSVFFTRSVK